MKIIETGEGAYQHVLGRRARSVLVPTMGALHRGHQELIRVAREQAGISGEVTVSIFVNPLQFEAGSDFQKYPRPEKDDEKVCREAGVDLLFRPTADEMYFRDESVYVEETSLSMGLCGTSRPGHFRGVCTVVSKLFNLLMPNVAVFGEKDYQQLAIIRRMVRDLNFPTAVVGVPTIRDADGLALSSRNRHLSADERAEAAVLRRGALAAQRLAQSGETSASKLVEAAKDVIASARSARIDYISLIDAETLEPLQTLRPKAVLALAVFIGGTRLIDNLRIA